MRVRFPLSAYGGTMEIVALVGLALLLAKRGSSGVQQSGGGRLGGGASNASSASPSPAPGGSKKDLIGAIVAAGTSAAGVAGGAGGASGATGGVTAALTAGGASVGGAVATGALVAVTGALGWKVTGDAWGALGAVDQLARQAAAGTGASAVGAQAGNVGRVLGRELDVMLGGDYGSVRNGVVQLASYVTGAAIGLGGLVWVPIVGQLWLLALALLTGITDAVRVAEAQSGKPETDTTAEIRERYQRVKPAMLSDLAQKGFAVLQGSDAARVDANAFSFAVGYAVANAECRRELLRRRPRGIGVPSEAAHLQWYRDRGAYVEPARVGELGNALRASLGIGAAPSGEFYEHGRFAARCAVFLEVLRQPWDPFVFGLGAHARVWWDRGGFAADEYRESDCSVRLGSVRVLGPESIAAGALVTAPA